MEPKRRVVITEDPWSEPLSKQHAKALASWWNCHDDTHVYSIHKADRALVGSRKLWIVYRWTVKGGA